MEPDPVQTSARATAAQAARRSPARMAPAGDARPAAEDQAAPSRPEPPPPRQLEALAEQISEALRRADVDLRIRVTETAPRRFVIELLDADGEVLRQIPPEHLLRVARSLQESGSGLLHEIVE